MSSVINKDEALRAKELAEGLMEKKDFTAARKLAVKAQKMDPTLENISRMMMVCDVHCAATSTLFGNEKDWYGILQVELSADDTNIKKQYKKLALLLHPDKNKLPGAESAFKLIGEAQRILLDKNSRMQHDNKRKTYRKPAAPAYKPQQVPNFRTQSVNLRNAFNGFNPEHRHPQQQAQAQPAHGLMFQTICPFCKLGALYYREYINRVVTCKSCQKPYMAHDASLQSGVPLSRSSAQTTFPFPQPNKFPPQKACNEPQKRPDEPASFEKASVPVSGYTAEKVSKKKRKNMVESSESSDSESSSDSDDAINDDSMSAPDCNGRRQPRRSVRSKRQVSYNENLSDDDADVVTDNGEGSQRNIDAEVKEELEDENQTHTDHKPNGINPNEKMKGVNGDVEEDSSSGDEAEPVVVECDDPDFNDFETLRAKNLFKANQIWALYDEDEQLPRFYAVIKEVKTPVFSVKYVWLEEAEKDEEKPKLPVSVGNYEAGGKEESTETNIFSHMMYERTKGRRYFKVFPRKGQIWALFKNWNVDLSSREYEFVEILSDHPEGTAVTVGFLSKVEGFKCVFGPMPKDGSETHEIPPHEFCRFSHCIPSFRLSGTEGRGVTEGWYELDPAALPSYVYQNRSGEEAAAQDQVHQPPPSGPAC